MVNPLLDYMYHHPSALLSNSNQYTPPFFVLSTTARSCGCCNLILCYQVYAPYSALILGNGTLRGLD